MKIDNCKLKICLLVYVSPARTTAGGRTGGFFFCPSGEVGGCCFTGSMFECEVWEVVFGVDGGVISLSCFFATPSTSLSASLSPDMFFEGMLACLPWVIIPGLFVLSESSEMGVGLLGSVFLLHSSGG